MQIDSIPQRAVVSRQAAGTDFFQVGLYVEHVPTGVFGYRCLRWTEVPSVGAPLSGDAA